jgi:hypothetical protein
MNWTTKPYKASNHPPVAILDMPEKFSVRSGEELNLKAHATDPDGDSLTFLWFQYFEAGSLKEKIKFAVAENMNNLSVLAPKVDHPQTVHFILRVADKGTPPIARYKRVIVTITP